MEIHYKFLQGPEGVIGACNPGKCVPKCDRKNKEAQGWGTSCFSGGPEFNSQKPHGGSEPSIVGSDALFWHKVNRALICIKQKNLEKRLRGNQIHLENIWSWNDIFRELSYCYKLCASLMLRENGM